MNLITSRNTDSSLVETVGFRIGTASFVGLITIILFQVISLLFIVPEIINTADIGVSILLSIIFTTLLPGLVFQSFLPILRDWISTTLEADGAGTPGINDRLIVLLSVSLVFMGILLYVYSPVLLDASEAHVINAFLNDGYSLAERLQIIYVDLITVCGFGLSAGFGIIAWYRIMYPRFCQNCGSSSISGGQCSSCGAEVVNRPSHIENLYVLLMNKGIRRYAVESETDSGDNPD